MSLVRLPARICPSVRAIAKRTGQRKRLMSSVCMVTKRLYYADTHLSTCTAVVLSTNHDAESFYVIPDKTIFHPQGGGQPIDIGTLSMGSKRYSVLDVKQDGELLQHYLPPEAKGIICTGASIELQIDIGMRLQFARLHTAGHLLADIVSARYPGLAGCKGNHFPGGQAFVCFMGDIGALDKSVMKATIEADFRALIREKRQVVTCSDIQPRTVGIEGFPPQPCGGTHLNSLDDISEFTVRSLKKQKGLLKIGYEVS